MFQRLPFPRRELNAKVPRKVHITFAQISDSFYFKIKNENKKGKFIKRSLTDKTQTFAFSLLMLTIPFD